MGREVGRCQDVGLSGRQASGRDNVGGGFPDRPVPDVYTGGDRRGRREHHPQVGDGTEQGRYTVGFLRNRRRPSRDLPAGLFPGMNDFRLRSEQYNNTKAKTHSWR